MKKNTLFAFVLGVTTGAFATWYYARKRYELIAQEEIDSVKEAFAKKMPSKTVEDKEEPKTAVDISRETDSLSKYARVLEKSRYTHYSKNEEFEAPADSMDISEREKAVPYVIPPENFGEFENYDCVSFTYYADNVLADDGEERVTDIEGTVGSESLNHFGEYSDDSVYVRNDRLKIDYEILKDERTYEELLESKPYLREV